MTDQGGSIVFAARRIGRLVDGRLPYGATTPHYLRGKRSSTGSATVGKPAARNTISMRPLTSAITDRNRIPGIFGVRYSSWRGMHALLHCVCSVVCGTTASLARRSLRSCRPARVRLRMMSRRLAADSAGRGRSCLHRATSGWMRRSSRDAESLEPTHSRPSSRQRTRRVSPGEDRVLGVLCVLVRLTP